MNKKKPVFRGHHLRGSGNGTQKVPTLIQPPAKPEPPRGGILPENYDFSDLYTEADQLIVTEDKP